jgi:3-phenylpropionate/trans-cinnamate dioxygenase ferredoxin reductase component
MSDARMDTALKMRPDTFYADKKIELVTQRRVVAIDRVHRQAAFDNDTVIDYGHFIFAVGARNRLLSVPGAELRGVHYLRTLNEAQAIKAKLAALKNIVVIGAGFIGLEFAMSAAKQRIHVTVIDVADRPMARALSPAMSAIFAREHQNHGVKMLFNTQTMRIRGRDGHATGVETVSGKIIPADLILIGIGVQPNVEVAAACGLEIRNGIVVDQQLQTQDAHISAIGDCAAHPNRHAAGTEIRVESVQNATDQARCVAARLTGRPYPYDSVPWFWSDQGELKLQIAGITAGADETVMRGDPAGTSCEIFCFRAGTLLGVETLNRPANHMLARKLLGQRIKLTSAQVRDEKLELKHLVAR